MTNNKPAIVIPCFEDEDIYKGLPMFVNEMIQPYFTLIKETDLAQNPDLYNKVQGVLIYLSKGFYTTDLLDKMGNLKVISIVSAGYDHLDLKYLKERNIRVGYIPDIQNDSVADLSMLLLLATSRRFKQGIENAMCKEPIEAFHYTSAYFGNDVTGKTLGIVGMGGIGFEVARRSMGFKMKVLYHNRHKRSDDQEVGAQFYSSLHGMLPHCDFVLISCPLNESTKHLFSTTEFQLMKNTSIIINVARGAVIDQKALTVALQTNEIRAAGLDVTYPEPLPRDHPLLQLDNVTVVPHIGSLTFETMSTVFQRSVDNLKAVLIDNISPMPSELNIKNLVG